MTDRNFSAVAMTTLQFSAVTEGPLHDLWSLLMFGKDGGEHRRLRRPVAPEFTPKAVEHYRRDIEVFADDVAAGLQGEVELWSQFALPLSARASCRIAGIPDDDADMVGRWGVDLVGAFYLMDDGMRAPPRSPWSQRSQRSRVASPRYDSPDPIRSNGITTPSTASSGSR